jgi:serine/threonine protein kinase
MKRKKWTAKTLLDKGRVTVFKLNRPKDSSIVLKILVGGDPTQRNKLVRENVAMDLLKNLAVPRRIPINRAQVSKLIQEKKFSYTSMEWIPAKDCYNRSFTATQSLGLWAFVVEQLTAFHRRKILYTDIKRGHLLVSEDLCEARIIDFDSCVMVESSGKYPAHVLAFGYTPQVAAPEFQFSPIHTERVIVYQLGMLLGSLLEEKFDNWNLNQVNFDNVREKLKKAKAEDIWKILLKTISKRPVVRPSDLEALFYIVQKCRFPSASYKIWQKLRTPFRKELLKLKFTDPMGSSPKLISVANEKAD